MKKHHIRKMIETFESELGPEKCWNWPYCKSMEGYPKLQIRQKQYYAHRIAYELGRGFKLKKCTLKRRCVTVPV